MVTTVRPLQILDRPLVFPHVCINCGLQEREFFVDTGIDITEHELYKAMWEGPIYFCNECMDNLVGDYQRALEAHGLRTARTVEPDQPDVGDADGESGPISGNIRRNIGDEQESKPPPAATLDSTNPFKLVLD